MLAAFNIIEKFEFMKLNELPENASLEKKRSFRRKDFFRKLAIRSTIILLTTLIGITVRTFTDFINIAGAVGSVTVAFVLPELLYLKAFSHKLSFAKKLGCVFIAVFGIVGSTYSIYYSVRKMMRDDLS